MIRFQLSTLFLVILAMSLLSSCYYNKRMVYLQGREFSESIPTKIKNENPAYRLMPNDVLSVRVKSSTEAGIAEIFNLTPAAGFMNMDPGNSFMQGYSISPAGKITLPILGTLVIHNLTVDEAQDLIQKEANRFLNNATVLVKLLSFKITVLGEVGSPGYKYIFNNQATLLEGLGLAGDLTQQGNRRKVKLIRQIPDGSEVVLLDLTDPTLLRSKYYYLQPNDVIYVEPFKANVKRSNLALAGIFFSAVTTTILLLNYFNND